MRPGETRPASARNAKSQPPTGKNQPEAGKSPTERATTAQPVTAQPILQEEEAIPDSLLHPLWKIQRTQPITEEDLQRNATDLMMPENLKQEVVYNDTLDRYRT